MFDDGEYSTLLRRRLQAGSDAEMSEEETGEMEDRGHDDWKFCSL